MYPQWSPVADVLLFQRARRRGEPYFGVWMVPLSGNEPGYATELSSSGVAGHILPSWSRDGRYIALCETEVGGEVVIGDRRPRSERSDIWVIDANGRGRIKVSDEMGADYAPAWSPDGRIFFSSTRAGAENIWSMTPRLPLPRDKDGMARTGGEPIPGGEG
jgi:Tol biopolymer transport system component